MPLYDCTIAVVYVWDAAHKVCLRTQGAATQHRHTPDRHAHYKTTLQKFPSCAVLVPGESAREIWGWH
jgi:hypothetical protein